MTGPTRPFEPLAKLLLTKQGAGKARRLRPKIAPAEVKRAIALLREWCADANLTDREQSDAVCRKMLTVAVEPRVPHPDQDWDLVAVYAGLRGIERGDACVELGLAVKVNSPAPATLDYQVTTASQCHEVAGSHTVKAAKSLKSAAHLPASVRTRRHLDAGDSPPPTHKPEPPKTKPKPKKAKLKPKKAKPPKPRLIPLKKLGWGRLGLVLRLVSSHGKGRRRRLRQRPDPEDVRLVMRLVQERFPDVNFCDHLWWSGFSCPRLYRDGTKSPQTAVGDSPGSEDVRPGANVHGPQGHRGQEGGVRGDGAARGGAPTRTRPFRLRRERRHHRVGSGRASATCSETCAAQGVPPHDQRPADEGGGSRTARRSFSPCS